MNEPHWRALEVACLVLSSLALPACFAPSGGGNSKSSVPPNWKLPTMGGSQFWTDVTHRSGWRIQRHFRTGHFRLLDSDNVRQAWGTLEQCEEALNSQDPPVPVHRGTVLILAHGLGRTSNCWNAMARQVRAETDWQVIRFDYASTRKPVRNHAAALAQLIQGLGPEVKTIHFAGHSLGNLVVRHYLADTHSSPDPRIGRFVMIGPPNHGSRMARLLQPTVLFPLITGPSGVSLGPGWDKLKDDLAIPTGEFGIIAGGHPDNRQGWNPLLKGASDGSVSLTEALLPGATDVMVQPLMHSFMTKNAEVCRATLRFLRTGCFAEDGVRHPIAGRASHTGSKPSDGSVASSVVHR